jgi:hypothetical protein
MMMPLAGKVSEQPSNRDRVSELVSTVSFTNKRSTALRIIDLALAIVRALELQDGESRSGLCHIRAVNTSAFYKVRILRLLSILRSPVQCPSTCQPRRSSRLLVVSLDLRGLLVAIPHNVVLFSSKLTTVLATGTIASLSIIGCPAALSLPQSAAVVWAGLYNNGIAIMPKFVGFVAASYGLAAYTVPNENINASSIRRGCLCAAVLAISIIPFTLLTMVPTNSVLLAIAAGTRAAKPPEVHELVSRWAVLNLVRSLLPLASAVLGTVVASGNIGV